MPVSSNTQFCDLVYNSTGLAGGGSPTFNWEKGAWGNCSVSCGG